MMKHVFFLTLTFLLASFLTACATTNGDETQSRKATTVRGRF